MDVRDVWTVAFGPGGWPAFAADGALARLRFGPRAALKRSPLYDDGLLVYPALQPIDPDVQAAREPGRRHALRVGNVQIEWTREAGAWRLAVRMAFQTCAAQRRLRVRVACLNGKFHDMADSVRSFHPPAAKDFEALGRAFEGQAQVATATALVSAGRASVAVFATDETGLRPTLVALFVRDRPVV
jgi:hypothetical protein